MTVNSGSKSSRVVSRLKRREYKAKDPIGAYLTVKGAAFILIGVTWLIFPSASREAGVNWSPIMTTWGAGAVWIIGGATAVVTGRFIPTRRSIGFQGLQGASLLMTLFFLCSSIIGFLPEAVIAGGRPASIITAISYGTFWVSSVLVAHMSTAGGTGGEI